jgi:hypothetical protein
MKERMKERKKERKKKERENIYKITTSCPINMERERWRKGRFSPV